MSLVPSSALLVTDVDRFSQDSESASVTLSSGIGEVVVFDYPCNAKVGSYVPNRLGVLEAPVLRSPYFADWSDEDRDLASADRLERTGEFSYRGCGFVLDSNDGLVLVRGFVLAFGELPIGAQHVEFEVTRLDCC